MARRRKKLFKASLGAITATRLESRLKARILYRLRKSIAFNIANPYMPSGRRMLREFFGISWRWVRIPGVVTIIKRWMQNQLKQMDKKEGNK